MKKYGKSLLALLMLCCILSTVALASNISIPEIEIDTLDSTEITSFQYTQNANKIISSPFYSDNLKIETVCRIFIYGPCIGTGSGI